MLTKLPFAFDPPLFLLGSCACSSLIHLYPSLWSFPQTVCIKSHTLPQSPYKTSHNSLWNAKMLFPLHPCSHLGCGPLQSAGNDRGRVSLLPPLFGFHSRDKGLMVLLGWYQGTVDLVHLFSLWLGSLDALRVRWLALTPTQGRIA